MSYKERQRLDTRVTIFKFPYLNAVNAVWSIFGNNNNTRNAAAYNAMSVEDLVIDPGRDDVERFQDYMQVHNKKMSYVLDHDLLPRISD